MRVRIAMVLWMLGASAWAQTPGRFFDAKKATEWAERHQGSGAAAKDAEDFARLTHAALAELKTSHVGLGLMALSST